MKKIFYLFLFLVSLKTQAQTPLKSWTGVVSTDWNDANNWDPVGVPTSDYAIIIPAAPTNQPTLNTLATLRYISLNGILTIGETGSLILTGDLVAGYAIALQSGTLINNGNLFVENAAIGVAIFLFGDSQIINNGTMTSEIGPFFAFLFPSSNNSIINNSTGIIRLSSGVIGSTMLSLNGTNGSLTNRGLFESTTRASLFNFGGTDMTVINSGIMRINDSGSILLENSTYSITNEDCGQIDLGSGFVNVQSGSLTNNGLIQTTGSMFKNNNSGTFSNVGVLKASVFSGITNFGLQISSSVTHPNPIFAYGDGNNYFVDDIYTDEAGTTLAGTFTGTNTFTPNSTATTLYALVGNGTCTFSVPFIYNPSPFPVKLLDFTGGSGPKSILVQWSTSEETANKGFEIMRSTNSKSWERIGYVAGSGDSKSTKSYDFEDLAPKMGINYYRLRQLDLDGGNEESRIIAVRFLGENAFMVYPNPVENDLSIRMPAGTDIQKVQVLNAAGQPMNVNLNPAYGLSLATLPAGLYFIDVQTIDGGRFTEKVMKK
ncbi:T9SS type A sorting domain-containing protein [Arundinibacter roseus]|uniref:T9SS type A sorting domain-containing protein n=1 Tax=Arundinibacter roseus TaxID=2070510 RepID=A0A4R4KLR3_9BACT|nr:T9SS type A sorting domain-containing protein [Arundinibacter roseus]TDB67571.1 T9SS type A sorting domain-containing protein [Arundinibacter roseus]